MSQYYLTHRVRTPSCYGVKYNMFYVYVDWTTDESPYIFYVGKGKTSRVKLTSRNAFHRNIKNKHGMRREVLFGTRDESFAFEEEVRLIALHNTYFYDNPKGANFTRGGEGSSGAQMSPESNQARSEKLKGIPKVPFSDEHLENLRAAKVGTKLTNEHRQNISKGVKASPNVGHPIDDETREKIAQKLRGRKQSAETIAKRSESLRKAREKRKLQSSTTGDHSPSA